MKKIFASAVLMFTLFFGFSQKEEINKELFYVGGGAVYSLEDEIPGFNIRAGLPMQKGFYFSVQATYLPDILDFGYKEFRYETNVELTLLTLGKFSFYGSGGLNFGMWKRTFSGPFFTNYKEPIKDSSLQFGAGISYGLKKVQFYTDWQSYPEIARNYFCAGVKIKFFESHNMKVAYYNYLKNRKSKSKTTIKQ